MKYSTQILLFLVFVTVGFVGYITYQIFMNEQDIVQSNIVFSISNNTLNKNNVILPKINYANLTEKDILNLLVDELVEPDKILENLYLAKIKTNKNQKTLMSLPGWNELLAKIFGEYMDWIGKDAKMQKLSTQMVADLSPYYDAKKCDLKKVTFGYALRLKEKLNSPHLGITDGYKIMFGDENYVKTFASAKKLTALSNDNVYWMAHELTHCEQYAGNRDKYAVRWFNELFKYAAKGFVSDFWKEIEKVITNFVFTGKWDFANVISMLSPEKLAQYDDNMPLEIEAYQRGVKVVGEVSKLRLQEQLKITPIKVTPTLIPVKINP